MKKNPLAPAHISVPTTGTTAGLTFYNSWNNIQDFFYWLVNMVVRIEQTEETIQKVLLILIIDPEKKKQLEDKWTNRQPLTEGLERHRQFLMEIVLVRHIENFLNYLSSLLYEIFTTRPETLRSSDKVELENVLRHDSIDSLVREIAERKIESLSYSSFPDLCDYFQNRFNLEIAPQSAMKALILAIETRNISVHNRCIINKRFIAKTGLADTTLGTVRAVYIGDIHSIVRLLMQCVKSLDKNARSKFKLRGVRANTHSGGVRPNRSLKPTEPPDDESSTKGAG